MGRGRSRNASHATDARGLQRVLADLEPPPREAAPGAHLYVLVGLPASGKSHVARALQEEWGVWQVQADRIRRLLGLHPGDHRAHGVAHGVATRLLADGKRVCLDANAATERVRKDLARLAAGLGAGMTIIHVDASPALRGARMAARRSGAGRDDEVDVPDAILRRMEQGLQVPQDALRVDGAGDLSDLRRGLAGMHPTGT